MEIMFPRREKTHRIYARSLLSLIKKNYFRSIENYFRSIENYFRSIETTFVA